MIALLLPILNLLAPWIGRLGAYLGFSEDQTRKFMAWVAQKQLESKRSATQAADDEAVAKALLAKRIQDEEKKP